MGKTPSSKTDLALAPREECGDSPTISTDRDWDELEALFRTVVSERIGEWVSSTSRHFQLNLRFATGRFLEGRRLGQFFREFLGREELRILDVGSGNGGVALALANYPGFEVTTVDLMPNSHLAEVAGKTRLSLAQTLADARALPFEASSYDIVICLDTLEHIPKPHVFGAEVMRVLRPDGVVMITTPPRLRYLFRRDPHFDVWGLMLLPNALQKLVVTRFLRAGDNVEHVYDIVNFYWHAEQIARLFPGRSRLHVTWNNPFPGPTRLHNKIWYHLRNLLWDRLLIFKPGSSDVSVRLN